MTGILITDDHPLFMIGLETVLRQNIPEMQLYQATTLKSAKSVLKSHPAISLMLLNRTLPGTDSLGYLHEFWSISPSLRIVIISVANSRRHLQAAVEAGATGFIPKASSPETIVKAIERLLAGGIYLPDDSLSPAPKHISPLSQRQTEILSLAAEGKSNKQIAAFLNLQEGTIEAHINTILKTLAATNRSHAIQIARTQGIIC